MSRLRRLAVLSLIGCVSYAAGPGLSATRSAGAADNSASTADKESRVSLDTTQQAISRRYLRFEEKLRKMAALMRKTDPDRANLLTRVIGESDAKFIVERMRELSEQLRERNYGKAIDEQDELIVELANLLELLGSEDRAKEIEAEKQRLKDLIRNVDALLGKQKGIRADTERRGASKNLQERQADLEERAQKLGEKIDQQDAERERKRRSDSGEESNGKQSDGKQSDGKQSDGKQSDGKQSDGKQSDGKQSDGKQSDGKQSDGKQSDGKQSDGQQSQDGSQQQPSTPGRKEIEEARKAMEDAAEKLKQKQRDNAAEDQTEAIAKLQQAKDRLEQILRQLREEERERRLTGLEDRFQQMLARQLVIYDNTVRLGKIPEAEREQTQNLFTKARDLSRQEAELVVDAEKALTLMKEEGSSVAFPEAIEQMRQDMQTIVSRLDEAKVGELTQMIEQDVIEALEDLIAALQKEIERHQEKKQSQGQQGSQNSPQDQALVDQLSELKMLRALQFRVNRRTKRLGRGSDGEQAIEPDIIAELRKLSLRQRQIQKATYNLVTGKNK